jgi:hypothetical protein
MVAQLLGVWALAMGSDSDGLSLGLKNGAKTSWQLGNAYFLD